MRKIISRTPVRISFFGGGTDYPDYYLRYPGAALGTTIDKYTYVSINDLSPFFDYKLRLSYSKIELVKAMEELQHPSVKGCLQFKETFPSIDIHVSSDLPAKTGLGSSSSFTVGFLNALYAMQGKKVSKQVLAEEACHVEQKIIQEHVGSQDQFHVAYGGLNVLEFGDHAPKVRPVIVSSEKRQLLEEDMLVFYTGLTRFANDVLKEQIHKTKKLDNDHYLQDMYDLVFEAEEVFSNTPPQNFMQELGYLLKKGWELKKQLSSKISNPFIDTCYQKALNRGAFGGKLCGAGSGGFLALFAPKDAHAGIREELKDLLEVHFGLESQGSTIIYMKDSHG